LESGLGRLDRDPAGGEEPERRLRRGFKEKKLSRMQEGTASESAVIKLARRSPSMGSGKGALMVERTQVSQSDGWGSGVIAIRVRFSCAKSDIHIMASMMPLSKGRREDGGRFTGKIVRTA
jgi:hypothetical protein